MRFLALLAVGDMEYALARNDVMTLLQDPDQNIQIAAAYAMTKLGQPEYYRIFRDAVTSEDQTVRANAALLLGKSGRKDATRFLYWTLQRADSSDKVVFQAAESIAMLGDEAVSLLQHSRIGCIGPVTADTARSLGLDVDIQPSEYTIAAFTEAIIEHFAGVTPSS